MMYTLAEGKCYWKREGNSRLEHWIEGRPSTWERIGKSPVIQTLDCAKCSEDARIELLFGNCKIPRADLKIPKPVVSSGWRDYTDGSSSTVGAVRTAWNIPLLQDWKGRSSACQRIV